ncbi:MAG TPA: PAS domain S-box protein, partial [Candidatus Omnitrophota bacterium]|nr:PAS domain S-box protein [Candidatus Omnitrophota bacterium]
MKHPATKRISPAGALAAIYGTFGALWIVLSDATVAMLFRDPDVLTVIQTSKGWLFVVLSAVLILVAGSRLMRALEASDERYRLLFADNPQPMALYDPATFRFIEANGAATRVFGYQPDEIAGMPVLELLVPEDRPQITALMEKARTSHEGRESIWTIRCKDARVVQVEA